MHRQIGNAVPLPLGRALGRELRETLYREWKEGRLIVQERDEDEEMRDVDVNEMREVDQNDDQEMREVGGDSDVDSNEGLYV
jgi:DNA (cytosine-5)-methyltransferase 1